MINCCCCGLSLEGTWKEEAIVKWKLIVLLSSVSPLGIWGLIFHDFQSFAMPITQHADKSDWWMTWKCFFLFYGNFNILYSKSAFIEFASPNWLVVIQSAIVACKHWSLIDGSAQKKEASAFRISIGNRKTCTVENITFINLKKELRTLIALKIS